MTAGAIARRYAKALYELVSQEGKTAETAEALEQLAVGVRDTDTTQLGPGMLDLASRRKLGAALAAPMGATSTLGKFVQVLADRGRLGELAGIQQHFLKLDDEANGRVRVDVTTAEPLGGAELEALLARFRAIAGRDVVPEVKVDPDLLGGAVVELEGKVYDGSIRSRLRRLTDQMAGGQ